jgi:glucose repression regulatory protein TUP1
MLRYVFAGHLNEIYALDYSQNGRYVVSGSADRTARVWDVKKGQHKVFQVDSAVEEAGITSISISSDNEFVAGGCLDQFIRIWNIKSGEMVAKLRGHSDSVYAVRFMPDGLRLVSGSLDCSVRYWDVSALPSFRRVSTLVPCPMVSSFKGHQVCGSLVN